MRIKILTGITGSGKTKILKHLLKINDNLNIINIDLI